MNKYGFEIFWSDEDEGYIATCPDFPGLSAFGETQAAALEEANIALKLFIESNEKDLQALPAPTKVSEYSGQIRLRMPKGLHAKAARNASREGISLNTFLVALIAESNGLYTFLSEMKEAFFDLPEQIAKKNEYHYHFHQGETILRKTMKYDLINEGEQYDTTIHPN